MAACNQPRELNLAASEQLGGGHGDADRSTPSSECVSLAEQSEYENQLQRQQQQHHQLTVPTLQRHSPSSSSNPNVHNAHALSQSSIGNLATQSSGLMGVAENSPDELDRHGQQQLFGSSQSIVKASNLCRPNTLTGFAPLGNEQMVPMTDSGRRYTGHYVPEFSGARRSASAMFRVPSEQFQDDKSIGRLSIDDNNNQAGPRQHQQQQHSHRYSDNSSNSNHWNRRPSHSLNSSINMGYIGAAGGTCMPGRLMGSKGDQVAAGETYEGQAANQDRKYSEFALGDCLLAAKCSPRQVITSA